MRSALALLGAALWVTAAMANVIDNFENGTNHGHWVGSNPNNTTLRPTGGNPGGWLNAVENIGEAFFQYPHDPANVFSGDYAAQGVTGFTVDLRTDQGFFQQDPEGCHVTLRLFWTNNGQYPSDIEAWYAGALRPVIGGGWQPYSFPVPATSPTIPAGWTVYEGNGMPGTNADWQYLMHNIDDVQIIYGEIGYAFPIRTWNIGMDNVTLVTVPEPATSALLIGGLLLARPRISRRHPHR